MNETEGSKPSSGETQLRYPLPTGARVDHYVIKEVLGAGGFGITYLAEHEGLGKLYAIKEYFPHAFSYRQGRTVRPSSASDGTYKWGLERFVTEARALAKFKHPAIVDVASIFEANGTAYIVLGYESGVDMSAWLKRLGRPPSQDELDRLLTPLLGALEEVHRHNMMHRDISPDNLLIRDDGRPVLIDFGSAREQIRGRARALSAIVKHGYSPPEQYTSKPELQGPWTDIYALSATLYRAIGGKLPPDATERFIRDELAPLAQLAQAPYRPGFLAAIDRGLKMKVEERPQTIVEWREMLFRPEPLRQPAGGRAERATPGEAANARSSAVASRRAGSKPVATGAAALAQSARPSVDSSIARAGETGSRRVDGAVLGGGSVRSRASSIPKSERPDLSWIDEADDVVLDDQPESDKGSSGQSVYYAILGLIGGAITGGLFSIVLASAISTNCFADSCIFRYLSICAAIGAVGGTVVGLKLARTASEAADAPGLGR
ncbi:MAG: protein kinase [Hyphomicrobiaceae bacterium]|nr:protein kinase [Hyphomicrobiaceae bacterium]